MFERTDFQSTQDDKVITYIHSLCNTVYRFFKWAKIQSSCIFNWVKKEGSSSSAFLMLHFTTVWAPQINTLRSSKVLWIEYFIQPHSCHHFSSSSCQNSCIRVYLWWWPWRPAVLRVPLSMRKNRLHWPSRSPQTCSIWQ